MTDGLVLHGRLVKLSDGESYMGRDPENPTGPRVEKRSRPSALLLAGDETVKVEFRDVASRDEWLIGAFGEKLPKVTADGIVSDMPVCAMAVRAYGPWDGESRTFGEVRFGAR